MQNTEKRPPKMLVVDDEETIRPPLRAYFTKRGYQVDCADGLAEAKAFLTSVDYDVAIVDLCFTGIGGAEGLDVVSSLRDQSPTAGIVLLTAHGTQAMEAEAKRRSADAILPKPQGLQGVAQLVFGLTERKLENV